MKSASHRQIQCEVCEPSADLSHNSIAPEITKCWYNSTEVTSSGHTLHALTATITNNTHLEYQSIFVEGYDLSKYRVGDIVKISGAENEWVVLPAFQDTTEHYPEQLSSDWEVRARNNYKNNYDHPHQFAVYPFRPKEMKEADAQSAQGGSPRHTFFNNYVKQRNYFMSGSTTASYKILDIPLSECSVVESARRWGGEITAAMSITQREDGYLLQNTASMIIGSNIIAILAVRPHMAQLIYRLFQIIAELIATVLGE